MASTDRVAGPRERLLDALRGALADGPDGTPGDAERLACLLVGRERFAAQVGEPPGGALAALPPPFDGTSLPGTVARALADRRPSLDASTNPAAIGDDYEATLHPDARGDRGQFFTPAAVADVLVRWALDGVATVDGPPRVLDPAAGTGTFLLAAYSRLADRAPDAEPTALLDRLVGVDVDGPALHLAGLRLAAAAGVPAPDRLGLHHGSFLDAETAGGALAATGVELSPVDAVVGNPPYVRAEALEPDTAHYRRHLAAFGPDGEAPLRDGPDALSRRSDAYVYFVTHATRFLRPGGRLALVLPTKWLMSAYGEGLRRFLRERYQVRAVCGFDARAFGDALVDTALLLAERDGGATTAPMRFVRVGGVDDLWSAVSGDDTAEAGTPAVERPQGALTASGSLARFLEAPAELLYLLDGPAFVRLDALAEVARGTMTGANRFFFVDEVTVDRFGLEPRFLRSAVKSLRAVDRPAVEAADVERRLVDVHPYVAGLRTSLADGVDLEAAVKDALAADGHDGMLGYVEHAEAEGDHEGRTCRSRAVWFDLGELRAPAAFVPKLLRERVFAVRNAAGAVPSNAIDGVWPAAGVDAGPLLAVLNASVGKAAMEVTGRDEAGMLQLMTYETASLPTLDVRTLAPTDREALAEAGAAYADDPGPATLAALDEAVDAAFDLPVGPGPLREQAASLRRRRVDGGETVAVLGD